MVTIRLKSEEVLNLPNVCMKCGQAATHYDAKVFSWTPPAWPGPIGTVGAILQTKQMRVSVPLCDKHRHHWTRHAPLVLWSLLGVAAIGIIPFYMFLDARESGQPLNPLLGLYCGIPFLGLMGWAVLFTLLQGQTIQALEITEKTITLKNVSEDFISEVERQRGRSGGSRR